MFTLRLHVLGTLEAADAEQLAARFPDVNLSYGAGAPGDVPDALLAWRGDMATLEPLVQEWPRLEWLHLTRAGVPLTLTEILRGRSTLLTNSSGVHAPGMGEYVVGMTLAHFQRHAELRAQQARSEWPGWFGFRELGGKTAGILGPGAIGMAAARRFRAFDMRIVGLRRRPEPIPELDQTYTPDQLLEFLAPLDVLVIAAPLTSETRGLLGQPQLAAMKRGVFLVNVARGAILDDDAVLDALRSGQLGGAALDAFAEEPLPADSPFWAAPNTVVTPHMSGKTDRVHQRRFDLFVHNLERFRAGEPLVNVVDLELGY